MHFYYVQQLVSEKAPITEKIIKDIHSLVLMDKPDDQRSLSQCTRYNHRGTVSRRNLTRPGTDEQLIIGQKGTKRHPIENAALFHLDFESIHPFIDGNGCTGRLILNLMLIQQSYPPT